MRKSPASSSSHAATVPSQTNLAGLTNAINDEMQNLKLNPSGFLESLMSTTPQFDGFFNTIQMFLSAAGASANIISNFQTVVASYNKLNAAFQKNHTVDSQTLTLLINQWTALFSLLNKIQLTNAQFSKAVNNVIVDVQNLIPNMMNSSNAAWQAYGEIACLTDASCFYSSSMPDNIDLPALDNVYEDISAVCNGPSENRQAYINQLATDLQVLQALYPT